jgi:hypothetical protein
MILTWPAWVMGPVITYLAPSWLAVVSTWTATSDVTLVNQRPGGPPVRPAHNPSLDLIGPSKRVRGEGDRSQERPAQTGIPDLALDLLVEGGGLLNPASG